MAITSLSVILAAGVVRVHYTKKKTRPSGVLKAIVLGCLARVLCLGNSYRSSKIVDEKVAMNGENNIPMNGEIDSLASVKGDVAKNDNFSTGPSLKLVRHLEAIETNTKKEEEAKSVVEEWQQIASVMDWFFFCINALVIVFASAFIYAKPVINAGGQ